MSLPALLWRVNRKTVISYEKNLSTILKTGRGWGFYKWLGDGEGF